MTQTSRLLIVHDAGRPSPNLSGIDRDAHVRSVDSDALPDVIEDTDLLFMWSFQSTALHKAWPKATNLKWIHTASAGVDRLLVPGLKDSDVILTNSRGVFDDALAEYVTSLVLLFAKRLQETMRFQSNRKWMHRELQLLEDKVALIVGVGPIGRRTAQLLRHFGVKPIGVGRTARSSDADFEEIISADDLHHSLPNADYVIVAAPLTDSTRGMFDITAFQAMKSSAYFINVGRGEIVVEDSLAVSLSSQTIAGAALDVFQEEPLPPESSLWDLPNIVISPHMGADFVSRFDALSSLFVANYERWRSGKDLLNVVDKTLGYVPSEPSERKP